MFREWSRAMFITLLGMFVLVAVELAVSIGLLVSVWSAKVITHTIENPAFIACLKTRTARNPGICPQERRIPG